MQPQQNPSLPDPVSQNVPTQPTAAGNPVGQPASAVTNAPQIADDSDRIEKDWVDKIKQLFHSTQQDPYQQSKQFAALKADYMQKRYGKTVQTKD